MKLIIATGNLHKVEELIELLKIDNCQIESALTVGGMPEVEETGTTFAANAYLKAQGLLEQIPQGAYVLADDSGLEVDCLDGAPGVYSARYAGLDADDQANREKLLQALKAVSVAQRAARFRCVLCLLTHGADPEYFDGSCEGAIASASQGSEGFGYDPIFIPEGYSQTFGELGEAVKHTLSHRARAVQKLSKRLQALCL